MPEGKKRRGREEEAADPDAFDLLSGLEIALLALNSMVPPNMDLAEVFSQIFDRILFCKDDWPG